MFTTIFIIYFDRGNFLVQLNVYITVYTRYTSYKFIIIESSDRKNEKRSVYRSCLITMIENFKKNFIRVDRITPYIV